MRPPFATPRRARSTQRLGGVPSMDFRFLGNGAFVVARIVLPADTTFAALRRGRGSSS